MTQSQLLSQLVIALCLWSGLSLQGQNLHYNSQQFGLRGTLLGGAVTSGNSDLSMAYYNPAALHMAEPTADLSLIQPRIQNFGFGNYFGLPANDRDIDVDFSPQLASYRHTVNDRINLVFITIKKSRWDYKVNSRSASAISNGLREQIFKYHYKGSERWLGLGGSYLINDHLAIGVSHFFNSSGYDYAYTVQSQDILDGASAPQRLYSDDLSVRWSDRLSMVTKLGLHWQASAHNVGLTLKTPNYGRMLAGGSYERILAVKTDSLSGLSNLVDFDLDPEIKTPWEINLGYSYRFNRHNRIWINAAYYTAIGDYTLARPQGSAEEAIEWRSSHPQILNFSIGYSDDISEHVEILAGYRTNVMAYENRAETDGVFRPVILDGDRHHISFGTNLHLRRNEILIGVDYGFSKADPERLFDPFPSLDQLDTGSPSYKNNSLTLIFTYGFILDNLSKMTDKIFEH